MRFYGLRTMGFSHMTKTVRTNMPETWPCDYKTTEKLKSELKTVANDWQPPYL